MSEVSIYALCEPDSGEVRYIGQTCMSLDKRLYYHIHEARTTAPPTAKHLWLLGLLGSKARPTVRVLQECSRDEADAREAQLIHDYCKRPGAALLNVKGGKAPRRLHSQMVRVEPDIYERITRLTKADDRTVAYIARRAMEAGLPLLEQEMAERGKVQA